MRPHNVVGRSSPPYRVIRPVRPSGAGLHRADQFPAIDAPVAGARLVLSAGVLIAIPLLALNLRPAVTSVGAMLTDIESGTGMSTVLASAVVAAPVWCFAIGGALAWAMRTRLGTARTVSIALAALAATLAARVLGGPYVLLGGTVVACLAIAVLGTLLPVITHAAPARAWALLTGCYVAAMGGGSGVGALITPQVAGHSSWQLGVSGWALLAAAAWAAWRVASRRFSEPPVRARKHPGPASLAPAGTAWSLTLHFGLASGFTFSIMGWLPSILLDYAHVPPGQVEWMFTVAMALGVPVALLVPKWARAKTGQSGVAVALAAPSLVATVGLLMFPGWNPWVWSICLGLGMPAVGLGLAMISMRAAADTDTAAALSSMVQGIGYAIAGATALACGLLHSSTQAWDWPLLGLLMILCGQIVTGMHAGLPITVYAGGRPDDQRLLPPSRPALPPAPRQAEPYPESPPLGIPLPRNGAEPMPDMAPAMVAAAPMSGPARRPVPTGEMAAFVNSMAPAGRLSVAMNAVPQYLRHAPGRTVQRHLPPGVADGLAGAQAPGRTSTWQGPTRSSMPAPAPGRNRPPQRPDDQGPVRPQRPGSGTPPPNGPVAAVAGGSVSAPVCAQEARVHGPDAPPMHGPELPPLHGPFPAPDPEDVSVIPEQRPAPDGAPAEALLPGSRRGEQAASPGGDVPVIPEQRSSRDGGPAAVDSSVTAPPPSRSEPSLLHGQAPGREGISAERSAGVGYPAVADSSVTEALLPGSRRDGRRRCRGRYPVGTEFRRFRLSSPRATGIRRWRTVR